MESLIDETLLARLANLKVIVKGRRKGKVADLHPSPRARVSVEFADHRDPASGDDFRHIDSNTYGHRNRVLVRSFMHKVDLPIYVLVAHSTSISLGIPSKARYAARLAAALAYLRLRGLDQVGLYPFTDRVLPVVVPRHGMGQMAHIVHAIEQMPSAGKSSTVRALTEFIFKSRQRGLVSLLSDFLPCAGHEKGLARLYRRGDEVVVIHILDPKELRPTIAGSVPPTGVETGRKTPLVIGRRMLVLYQRRLGACLAGLCGYLSKQWVPYVLAPTYVPLKLLIHEWLRNGGILR